MKIKRFFAVLLVLAMVLAMAPTFVFAAEGESVTILYTNDVHTYIDNADKFDKEGNLVKYGVRYSHVAGYKQELEAAGENVLLVDAGDHIQGTAYGSMDNGETIIKLMNASGYDLATLGNHEFDYGMARTLNLWNESNFPYVSANFYSIEKEALVLDSYKVFEKGGKKIALVGLTTPESFTKSTPAYFQNEDGEYIYDIFGGTDGKGLYEAAQTAIDAARKEADVVIALGHLGDDPASQPWTSEELIANTTGLDAFIDGHSHSTVPYREVADKEGKTVVLTQTGSYLGAVGQLTIAADGTIKTELVTPHGTQDETVKAMEEAWIKSVNDELGQVIGAATVTFDNYEDGKRLVRTYETNTGDFAADALYYLFDNMGLDVDIAVMNGGGVRNKAITGELSYLSCKSIHTFGNVACLQTVTGQQILDALEFGSRFAPEAECGGFLQVSGNVSYEVHTYIPNTIVTDEKSVWQAGPTGAYRVQNVMIDGKPLDLTAKYNLAGYNYTLRDLGDGFAMFDGAVNVLDYVMQDYMVLANYVQSFPKDETTGLPTITAENSPYGNVRGEGRITMVEEAPITILYTNDVHTYIDNSGLRYSNVAAMKSDLEDAKAPVLLVDAGDHIQGTAFGSMDNGETIIKLMNASGYDLATLGNHEFDYGMARTLNLWNESEFPYVSANFYSIENEALVLDSYKVFELGGKKVALVGLTTPESFTKSTPAYFQNEDGEYIYDIFGGEDGKGLYEAAQTAIDAARKEADVVIALGHLGDDPASQPWTSEELIANTTGLDAFIDGHSHSTVPCREVADKEGNTVILTQTGSYLGSVGVLTIDAEGNVSTKLETSYHHKDEEVASIEDAWIKDVNDQLGVVIGAATVTFDNYENGKRLVRTYETNTGDFAADALYYLFDNMGLDVDIAVMNGGGVRNKAITGELSFKTCKDIHTFGNVACLQTVTGQQILDALEFGARFAPDAECGGFLQVSGNVSYEVHTYVPNTIVTDEKSVWQAGPTGEYRVRNVMINGEPLDLTAKYNLAGYNYTLRDLGDGFAMFDGAVNVLDYVMQDYMVLANYVKSFPVDETTGLPTITAENSPYGNVRGEGRITMVTEKPLSFEDVKPTAWYYDDVKFMVDTGLMVGMSDTTFAPKETLTRAQIITILYRMSGASVEAEQVFNDVKPTSWYGEAATWAYQTGLSKGVGKGNFGPKDAVSRQDLVVLLGRYATTVLNVSELQSADLSGFADSGKVASYAVPFMEWAVAIHLVNGDEKGNLNPKGTATRAEVAAMVHRFVNAFTPV